MNIKLLKKWRAKADKLFFKDFSVSFYKQLKINIPEFNSGIDCDGHITFRLLIRYMNYYDEECIIAKDLKSKLRKSYKNFVDEYLKYMLCKTKGKHPYKSFKIKIFRIKHR